MGDSTMVLESTRPHLKKLAVAADRLNKASDRYTDELKAIEAELAEIKLGIEYRAKDPFFYEDTYQIENPEEGTACRFDDAYFLAYGRYGDKWRLMVSKYRRDIDEDGDIGGDETFISQFPLVDASRRLRVKAATTLSGFLQELTEAAEQAIASLDRVSDARNQEVPKPTRPDVPGSRGILVPKVPTSDMPHRKLS